MILAMEEQRWVRVLNAALAVLFLVAAVVQYNDPDPWRWVAIYLAGVVVCVLHGRHQQAWIGALVVAAVALFWSSALLPGVVGRISTSELFQPMEPGGGPIEEGREAGGLLIIVAWMVFLVVRRFRRR